MKNIHVIVRDKIAVCPQRDAYIVCMNKVNEAEDSGYKIVFRFDAEWDKYTKKTARFVWNGEYFDKKFEGNVCPVPVITGTDVVEVGVYAGDLSTTTSAKIPCKESVLCKTSKPSDGAIKEYRDEAAKFADRAEESAENAAESAENAKASADDSARSASGAVLSAESASLSAEEAGKSADAAAESAKQSALSAEEAGQSASAAAQTAENINDDLENYLPLEGGELTGELSTVAKNPLFIGKNGKVGIRAVTPDVGYNELVVTRDGIEYADESGTVYKVLHSGDKAIPKGVATLDENGHVPSTQLPSYVDTVVEGYVSDDKKTFYEDSAKTKPITPESGKIYLDLVSLCTYRWGSTMYAEISESLALGETANTAYYGDRGKAAYDHSQIDSGNPHGTTLADFSINVSANEINRLDGARSNLQKQIDNKADDFSIELYNGNHGNPNPVKFATADYSECDSENGILAKISMVSGHGNGSSYTFLQDLIIGVTFTGVVTVNNSKHYGQKTTYEGSRQFGDIFWVVDADKKIVDFYCLMGQYARVNMTPWKRLTYSGKGTITQYKTCTLYSSGEKVWANNGNIASKTETWTFTLEDGSTVDKAVYVG